MLRSSVLAMVVLATACIAEPRFDLHDGEPETAGGRTVPVSGEGDDAMVLIPATVITAPGDLAPSTPEKSDGGEREKRGKGKDAGTPEPSAPPAPSPSETVSAFWLDVREASAAAYDACVRAGACTAPGSEPGCTLAAGLGAHPINCVTLEQARGYCAWRGKRLPRNDEWTVASAGGTGRPYPWGVDAPSFERLNACGSECSAPSMYPQDDGYPRTAPRGSYPLGRSPEGVFDLAGNVAEWIDLSGASVVRGGSFDDVDVAAVSAMAARTVPVGGASVAIGFRCAKDG